MPIALSPSPQMPLCPFPCVAMSPASASSARSRARFILSVPKGREVRACLALTQLLKDAVFRGEACGTCLGQVWLCRKSWGKDMGMTGSDDTLRHGLPHSSG